jgi:hypothetical protein
MRHKVTRELSAQHTEAVSAVRREAAAAAACQAAAAAAREAAAMDIARVSAAAWEAAVAREVVAREAAAEREEAAATAAARARLKTPEAFDVQACNLRFMALRQFVELARRGAGKPKPWRITLRRAFLVNDLLSEFGKRKGGAAVPIVFTCHRMNPL